MTAATMFNPTTPFARDLRSPSRHWDELPVLLVLAAVFTGAVTLALLIAALGAFGVWLLLQPMEMRGTFTAGG